MTPYEIEQSAKQTLLRSNEVEIWVRHLSDARKHRQAGAQKATAKRKGKSFKKSGKVPRSELWCICGGPECLDTIACEHKDCSIEWLHFQYWAFNRTKLRVVLRTVQGCGHGEFTLEDGVYTREFNLNFSLNKFSLCQY